MKFTIPAILFAATSVVSAVELTVLVGKADNGSAALVFTPDHVTAKVGDQIHFQFHAKNHTVTQSSFAQPCTQQRNTVTNELGVDSGFMPVNATATEIPVWTVEVKQDTSPIWMFCNQVEHCNKGMVFAINPPESGNTFSAYQAKALIANHPDPALHQTADFTPPAAQGSAPPAGSDSAAVSSSAAVSGSASLSGSIISPTVAPSADQANAAPASSTLAKPSGALSAVRVPGAGIALTLVGLLAGMLL